MGASACYWRSEETTFCNGPKITLALFHYEWDAKCTIARKQHPLSLAQLPWNTGMRSFLQPPTKSLHFLPLNNVTSLGNLQI
jgi:hypothetical protein